MAPPFFFSLFLFFISYSEKHKWREQNLQREKILEAQELDHQVQVVLLLPVLVRGGGIGISLEVSSKP